MDKHINHDESKTRTHRMSKPQKQEQKYSFKRFGFARLTLKGQFNHFLIERFNHSIFMWFTIVFQSRSNDITQ